MSRRVERTRTGAWEVRPYLGTNPVTRRRIRPSRTFPGELSREEAQALADAWVAQVEESLAPRGGTTVAEAGELYLRHLEAAEAKPATLKTYRTSLRCCIDPYLGRAPVAAVESWMIQGAWDELAADGLAGATVRKAHWLLSGMFAWAITEKMRPTGDNPVDAVDAPPGSSREAVAVFEGDFAALCDALLAALRDEGAPWNERMAAWAALDSLFTGLRCGEACGLRRGDDSALRREQSVTGTVTEAGGLARVPPKTPRSRRVVGYSEELAEVALEASSIVAGCIGRRWTRTSTAPLAPSDTGGLLRPSSISAAFTSLARRAGMPAGTTFHSMRHTHASVLLADRWSARAVSERLGHSTVTTTLAIYGHLMRGFDGEMAAGFGGAARRMGWSA